MYVCISHIFSSHLWVSCIYWIPRFSNEVATGRGLPTERRPFLGVIGEQGQAPRGTPGWPVYAGFTIENGGFTIETGDFIMENG